MKKLFFVAVLLTAVAGIAQAESIEQTFGVFGGNVDMFDPAMGTLDAVTMELEIGGWGGTARLSNDLVDPFPMGGDPMCDGQPDDGNYSLEAYYRWTVANIGGIGNSYLSAYSSEGQSGYICAWESQDVPFNSAGRVVSKDLTASLGSFIGTDTLTVATSTMESLYVAFWDTYGDGLPPRCEWLNQIPPAFYSGTLTYEYTSVPEPSTLVLLVFAAGACLFFNSRK